MGYKVLISCDFHVNAGPSLETDTSRMKSIKQTFRLLQLDGKD